LVVLHNLLSVSDIQGQSWRDSVQVNFTYSPNVC